MSSAHESKTHQTASLEVKSGAIPHTYLEEFIEDLFQKRNELLEQYKSSPRAQRKIEESLARVENELLKFINSPTAIRATSLRNCLSHEKLHLESSIPELDTFYQSFSWKIQTIYENPVIVVDFSEQMDGLTKAIGDLYQKLKSSSDAYSNKEKDLEAKQNEIQRIFSEEIKPKKDKLDTISRREQELLERLPTSATGSYVEDGSKATIEALEREKKDLENRKAEVQQSAEEKAKKDATSQKLQDEIDKLDQSLTKEKDRKNAAEEKRKREDDRRRSLIPGIDEKQKSEIIQELLAEFKGYKPRKDKLHLELVEPEKKKADAEKALKDARESLDKKEGAKLRRNRKKWETCRKQYRDVPRRLSEFYEAPTRENAVKLQNFFLGKANMIGLGHDQIDELIEPYHQFYVKIGRMLKYKAPADVSPLEEKLRAAFANDVRRELSLMAHRIVSLTISEISDRDVFTLDVDAIKRIYDNVANIFPTLEQKLKEAKYSFSDYQLSGQDYRVIPRENGEQQQLQLLNQNGETTTVLKLAQTSAKICAFLESKEELNATRMNEINATFLELTSDPNLRRYFNRGSSLLSSDAVYSSSRAQEYLAKNGLDESYPNSTIARLRTKHEHLQSDLRSIRQAPHAEPQSVVMTPPQKTPKKQTTETKESISRSEIKIAELISDLRTCRSGIGKNMENSRRQRIEVVARAREVRQRAFERFTDIQAQLQKVIQSLDALDEKEQKSTKELALAKTQLQQATQELISETKDSKIAIAKAATTLPVFIQDESQEQKARTDLAAAEEEETKANNFFIVTNTKVKITHQDSLTYDTYLSDLIGEDLTEKTFGLTRTPNPELEQKISLAKQNSQTAREAYLQATQQKQISESAYRVATAKRKKAEAMLRVITAGKDLKETREQVQKFANPHEQIEHAAIFLETARKKEQQAIDDLNISVAYERLLHPIEDELFQLRLNPIKLISHSKYTALSKKLEETTKQLSLLGSGPWHQKQKLKNFFSKALKELAMLRINLFAERLTGLLEKYLRGKDLSGIRSWGREFVRNDAEWKMLVTEVKRTGKTAFETKQASEPNSRTAIIKYFNPNSASSESSSEARKADDVAKMEHAIKLLDLTRRAKKGIVDFESFRLAFTQLTDREQIDIFNSKNANRWIFWGSSDYVKLITQLRKEFLGSEAEAPQPSAAASHTAAPEMKR